jgi:hypothetical protein
MTIADVAKAVSRSMEWQEPTRSGGMHSIKSGPYLITKQGNRYQASKLAKWENLGPAMTLAEAKKLCEDDKGNE